MVQQARDLGHSHTQDTLDTHLTLDTLTLLDQAADPTASGGMQRNGPAILLHDGSSAKKLALIEVGTVSIAVTNAANTFTQAVVFAEVFASAPKVIISGGTLAGQGFATVAALSVTATGFTAAVYHTTEAVFAGSATYTAHWVAFA